MINITVNRNNDEYKLSMIGHANFSTGNDIVCAGASAIAYSLIGFLGNNADGTDITEKSGNLNIVCRNADPKIEAAFEMAVIGLLQLELTYPKNVSVDIKNSKLEA